MIKMSDEAKILTMFLICALLIFSYQYVIDETEAAATADPTHTGKALLAEIMPWLWLMFIILALAVAVVVISDSLK